MPKSLLPEKELKLLSSNKYSRIIGIDEVGRGCWAGPVFVGAYIFDKETPVLNGVYDSKALSESKRVSIVDQLQKHKFSIYYLAPNEIDRNGITVSVNYLMKQIISFFSDGNTYFYVDGYFKNGFGENTEMVKKGDSTYYSIAAASVLAKVSRDEYMNYIDSRYPGYGFAKNKGYGTKQHIESLDRLGICKVHRKSYKPIKNFAQR